MNIITSLLNGWRKTQVSQRKKNYLNYKLDCLLLGKKPISYNQFKKEYANKEYHEENIF